MTELVGSVSLYEESQAPTSLENVGTVSLLFEQLGESYLAKPFGAPETSTPVSGGSATLKHDAITVTVQHILQKSFPLTHIPVNPNAAIFLPEGGIPQFVGEDFVIDDNILSWDGLGLDGFIEENDIIHVYYT